MIVDFPILSFLIFFPILGAVVICILSYFTNCKRTILGMGLIISLINFIASLYMWYSFDHSMVSMQFIEKFQWFHAWELFYYLGVDGISLFLIILTTFLIPLCLLSSYNISRKFADYIILFLLLESLIIGAFCALDIILFYIFFEAVLIPMFFIIGIWGGANRVYASFKFFLYTLFGSLFMLIAILYILFTAGTADIVLLREIVPFYHIDIQKWLWLGFFISFAIKMPMWPVHTWLPDAHVQAPTSGSMILAGVLLKLGGYGFLRFSLPLFPDASIYFADFVLILSIIAVIYTSLVALVQVDMKKLIAYSSVAHMGFVTAGIFIFKNHGINGALFQMISHGIVSAALFLCVGVLYDRMHTKEINFYNGLIAKVPHFAVIFMIFTLASIGLPSTSGFIGEFLVILSVFQVNQIYSLLIATAMVLGAAYMLWLYARVMFGDIANNKLNKIVDINIREAIAFWPMIIVTLLLGICPSIIFHFTDYAVMDLVNNIQNLIIK